MPIQRRWPAPWIFSLLILPLGMVYGFNFTALPFLLAKAGVPVDRIASVSAISSLPGVLAVLIAPIVDIKLRRRTWLAIGIFGTAIAACIYFPLIGASRLILMTALIFAGGMVTFLVMAACGGLMVRMLTSTDQSKASAWLQVGILGGGGLSAAMVLWLAVRMPLVAAAFCFAIVTALVGYVPFTIREPAPEPSPWFSGRLVVIGKEIWALARSRERRWGSLLLLSPCATGAAQSLLPAIASHYGVGGGGVVWINGIGGSVALALGALCSTLVPGNWDRRLTYAAAGVTNALAAIFLLAANPTSGLSGRYGLLPRYRRSLRGPKRGAYRGDRRTRGPRRQHFVLIAERCRQSSNRLCDLARRRRLPLLWDAWAFVDRCGVQLPCVWHCCCNFRELRSRPAARFPDTGSRI